MLLRRHPLGARTGHTQATETPDRRLEIYEQLNQCHHTKTRGPTENKGDKPTRLCPRKATTDSRCARIQARFSPQVLSGFMRGSVFPGQAGELSYCHRRCGPSAAWKELACDYFSSHPECGHTGLEAELLGAVPCRTARTLPSLSHSRFT